MTKASIFCCYLSQVSAFYIRKWQVTNISNLIDCFSLGFVIKRDTKNKRSGLSCLPAVMMRPPIKRFLMNAVRARIMWLWLAGCSARDISIRTGTSVSTVYRWLRRCNKAYMEKESLAKQTEGVNSYYDVRTHLNLQLRMYSLTTARGQYLDSYHILRSILEKSLYNSMPVTSYHMYENTCDAK